MNKLLWMLDDTPTTGLEGAKATLETKLLPVVETVIWVLVVVLAVVFIIKAITTAMAVMKAADEPQVRQEKLNGFKYLAIGLGVAIVILSLSGVIINIARDNANAVDLEKAAETFLF